MADRPDIDGLWNFNDPAASELRFRDACATARAAGDAEQVSLLLTQVARAQGLQRRFDDAHATLDEVTHVPGASGVATRIRCLLERGRVFNSAGRRGEARPLFDEAFRLACDSGVEPLAIDAAHMLAIASDPVEAIAWNTRALDMAESSADSKARKWRASLNNNLGWAHHDRGDFAQALVHFECALMQRRERGDAADIRIARWCVARALRSLGELESALSAQRALLAEHEAAGTADGFVHEELGECLLSLGRAGEAHAHFARAHDLLSSDPWLAEREPHRIARLHSLGAPTSQPLTPGS